MFKGMLTALVTPFRSGAVDARALGELVEAQIAGGAHGLVPCGSTGESSFARAPSSATFSRSLAALGASNRWM